MDNLSSHQNKTYLEFLKPTGIKIILNSPYSPEINIIEYIFN